MFWVVAKAGGGLRNTCSKKGFNVFLSDNGTLTDENRETLIAYGIDYEEGGHTEERVFRQTK